MQIILNMLNWKCLRDTQATASSKYVVSATLEIRRSGVKM